MSAEAAGEAPLCVLYLEDAPLDAELVCAQLTQTGHTLKADVVSNRDDFVAALDTGAYDIILADYRLPGFDAHAALRLAQQQRPGVPFIVVSGTIGEETAVELLKQGATDYVIKDRLERLPSAVRRALDEAAQRQARLQAERALRESEEQLSRAVEGSGAGLWDWTVQTGEAAFNERWAEIVGYTLAELSPLSVDTWTSLCHPEDLRRSQELLEQHFSGRSPIYECETRMRHKDGHWVWVLARGKVLQRDSDGRPVRMAGTHLDVGERKRAEEAVAAGAERLRATLHDTVRAMGAIIDLRDPYTGDHQRRVTRLTDAIAAHMGLDADRREGLHLACEVHDVGKIGVPAEILSKPARLTDVELSLVRQHAVIGRQILSSVAFDWPIAEIVGQHHERLDGSGYPDGLKGDEMLPEARIIQVADVVEAMASHRPYRPSLGVEAALAEVREGAGTRYDADVVAVCETVFAAGFELDDHPA